MMAVFYDTGGGDIYAGPTKDAVIAEMRKDCGADFNEDDIFEVPGTYQMRTTEAKNAPLVSLAEEYTEGLGTYCIASENC